MSAAASRRAAVLKRHLFPTAEGAAASEQTAGATAQTAPADIEDAGKCGKSCGSCDHKDACERPTRGRANLYRPDTTFDTPGIGLRAKSRLAGPNGNYWYGVEIGENVPRGVVRTIVFWKTDICIWRGENGVLTATEDRCAHRQLRLSKGTVQGDNITCCYHGWEYDQTGKVVKMAHEIPKSFKSTPTIKIRVYPVKEKYGMIFLFPGDPDLAEQTPLPTIPWLDRPNPTPFKFVDMTVNANFTLIIENNCDFYHAFLHRKYRPFWWPELKSVERVGDAVTVNYKTDMESGAAAKAMANKGGERPLNDMRLWFDYPVQRSNLVDKYLHWMFSTPMDERTTRTIYIFLWDFMEIPVVNISIPYSLRAPILWGVHKYYLLPVLCQDLYALEEEQGMNDKHQHKHSYELNPLVSAFQRLTVEKWDQYLKSEAARVARITPRQWRMSHGAGLTDYAWADYK